MESGRKGGKNEQGTKKKGCKKDCHPKGESVTLERNSRGFGKEGKGGKEEKGKKENQ